MATAKLYPAAQTPPPAHLRPRPHPRATRPHVPSPHHPCPQSHFGFRSIATCLLLSSLGKCFALLHAIWDYPAVFAHAIELFVLTCNAVAINAQLRCSACDAVLIVAISAAARATFELGLHGIFPRKWEISEGVLQRIEADPASCTVDHVASTTCTVCTQFAF